MLLVLKDHKALKVQLGRSGRLAQLVHRVRLGLKDHKGRPERKVLRVPTQRFPDRKDRQGRKASRVRKVSRARRASQVHKVHKDRTA